MNRKIAFLRRAPFLFLVLALGLTTAGCLFSPDEGGDGNPQPINLQRTSIDKTIEYLELVWKHKLYTEYELVLHDQYEFFPREDDAKDFPWLQGSAGPKRKSSTSPRTCSIRTFSGVANPIDAIEIELIELSRRTW